MDYFNLFTNSVWHVNPDDTGFEKIDAWTLQKLGGAYWWLPKYALMPKQSNKE